MKFKSTLIGTAISCAFVMSILGETFAAVSATTEVQDKTIASKQAGNLVILLTNDTGKLINGENYVCVLFQRASSTPAPDIREVRVDFGLRVGRFQEPPITASLTQDGADRYCGHVNLEESHYQPASYYTTVRYVEGTGKKKSASFFVTVR